MSNSSFSIRRLITSSLSSGLPSNSQSTSIISYISARKSYIKLKPSPTNSPLQTSIYRNYRTPSNLMLKPLLLLTTISQSKISLFSREAEFHQLKRYSRRKNHRWALIVSSQPLTVTSSKGIINILFIFIFIIFIFIIIRLFAYKKSGYYWIQPDCVPHPLRVFCNFDDFEFGKDVAYYGNTKISSQMLTVKNLNDAR